MGEIVSLWRFSCNVYQHTDVQQACMRLQDQRGIDVLLLLFCCWSARLEGQLSITQLEKACEISAYWTDSCIRPLRHIRQDMKLKQGLEGWEPLRKQIKSNELAAEKSLLDSLERTLQLTQLPQPSTTVQYVPLVMEYIIYCFPSLSLSGKADSVYKSAITDVAVVIYAAQPDMQYHSLPALVDYISNGFLRNT